MQNATPLDLGYYNLTPDSSLNCSLILNDYCESDEDYVSRIKEYLRLTAFKYVIIVLYLIVFIVGVVGNFLVCLIVLKNKHMRSVTNVFIVNLAFSDLLVLLLCLPMTVVEDVLKTWFFGEATCKIIKLFQHISILLSILTLLAISTERWYAICRPLKFRSSLPRACAAILTIWLLSVTMGIPQIFSMSAVHFEKVPKNVTWLTSCHSTWPNTVVMSEKIVQIGLFFILPLLWMITAYVMIIEKLWFHPDIFVASNREDMQKLRSSSASRVQSTGMNNQLKSRKKVCVMLIIMVVMFFFCYLPTHAIQILRLCVPSNYWDMRPILAQYFNKFGIISHWLCYYNSAINPVIYTFMSSKFKRELSRMCCHCRLQLIPNYSQTYGENTMYMRNRVNNES